MENQGGSPSSDAGAGGAGAEAKPGLPTEAEMLAKYDDKSGAAAVEQPGGSAPKKPDAEAKPEEDLDGDKAFEAEFKDFRMPDGLKKRISGLTEQRNKAREEAKAKADLEKEHGFFKPYANDKGKQYLSTLVEFDSLMEEAFTSNPWLADLVRHVVVEGKGTAADKAKVIALVNEAKEEAAEEAAGGEEAGTKPDPRDKQLKELLQWKKDQEGKEKQTADLVQRRKAIDKEKESYRAEIAEFEKVNPQYKDDKEFKRLALQISAARNISFTEAAKFVSGYVSDREKAVLKNLGKADQERQGAGVEKPGASAVPVKKRPAIGSDEEAEEMDAAFSGSGG